MGRRKIEIQPIQHDRNRSVTFLKRKNGLFKKAYELGVLCSADVAVIVFGHNSKLYEYCSTDLSTLLARHREYSGERDLKGPQDFAADKNDGGDEDSDASAPGDGGGLGGGGGGGDGPSKPPPPPAKRGDDSGPRGKGKPPPGRTTTSISTTSAQHHGPQTRYAIPSPLPLDATPTLPTPPTLPLPSSTAAPRPSSVARPIKREELPALITSLHPAHQPPTSAPAHGGGMRGGGSPMAWEGRGPMSASTVYGGGGGYGMRQQQEGGWGGGGGGGMGGERQGWDGGLSASTGSAGSTPLNSFYPSPHIPISRPLHPLLSNTPAHHAPAQHHNPHGPPSVNDILAANPHLAQQLAASAGPHHYGGGGGGGGHPLYSNPLFEDLFNPNASHPSQHPQHPSTSSAQATAAEMDWHASRRLAQPSMPYAVERNVGPGPHGGGGGGGEYWFDELWPDSQGGDGGRGVGGMGGGGGREMYPPDMGTAYNHHPQQHHPAQRPASLKRSLGTGTPISPAESGTPREEGDDYEEDEMAGGKKVRVR